MFSAIYTPSLKEYVHIEGEQGGTPSGIVRNEDFVATFGVNANVNEHLLCSSITA